MIGMAVFAAIALVFLTVLLSYACCVAAGRAGNPTVLRNRRADG